MALSPVLSLTSAQELPLPATDTGDETWFEAASLRPPLSLLGEASVLSRPVRVEAQSIDRNCSGPSTSAFSPIPWSRA